MSPAEVTQFWIGVALAWYVWGLFVPTLMLARPRKRHLVEGEQHDTPGKRTRRH